MDRFGPTGKVSKKLVHLLRWSSFPGRTGWNFGWMDRAHNLQVEMRLKISFVLGCSIFRVYIAWYCNSSRIQSDSLIDKITTQVLWFEKITTCHDVCGGNSQELALSAFTMLHFSHFLANANNKTRWSSAGGKRSGAWLRNFWSQSFSSACVRRYAGSQAKRDVFCGALSQIWRPHQRI